jgi:hypothetical protein
VDEQNGVTLEICETRHEGRWMIVDAEDSSAVHVLPLDDLTTHSPTDDCVCGADVEPIERLDGSLAYVITHPSLDGRERKPFDHNNQT